MTSIVSFSVARAHKYTATQKIYKTSVLSIWITFTICCRLQILFLPLAKTFQYGAQRNLETHIQISRTDFVLSQICWNRSHQRTWRKSRKTQDEVERIAGYSLFTIHLLFTRRASSIFYK